MEEEEEEEVEAEIEEEDPVAVDEGVEAVPEAEEEAVVKAPPTTIVLDPDREKWRI